MMNSHIRVTNDQALQRIVLSGAFDAKLSAKLEKVFTESRGMDLKAVTIELSQVSFITADAVRVLLNAHINAVNGMSLLLLNPNEDVRQLIETVGLNAMLSD